MRFLNCLQRLLLTYVFFVLTASCHTVTHKIKRNVVQNASGEFPTRSVTFLSSGYTEKEYDLFQNDVSLSVEALQNKSGTVDAGPWSKYAPQLDIYSVFQPSDLSGAAVDEKNRTQNNLECVLSKINPTVVTCSLSAIYSLAAVAATSATDLVVVLVNEPGIMRAAGGKSLAILTNNKLFISFFVVRELSKAAAGLVDEYTHGVEEDDVTVRLPNCAASIKEAHMKWKSFIDKGLLGKGLTKGCFFNNYYRPTENQCMMRDSSMKSMCVVCEDHLKKFLFNSTLANLLTSGRGFMKSQKLCVDDAKDLQLGVGEVGKQDGVVVDWLYENGTEIRKGYFPYLELSSALLKSLKFPINIKAVINNNFSHAGSDISLSNFKTETTFSLVEQQSCNNTEYRPSGVLRSCKGGRCAAILLSKQKNISFQITKDPEERKGLKIAVVTVCCIFIFLAFLLLTVLYWFCYYNRPHEIIFLDCVDNLIWVLALVFSVIVSIFTLYSLAWITYYFEIHAALWRQLLIPSAALLAFGSIMAVVNYATVLFFRYKCAIFCGIVMFVLGLLFVGVGVFLICLQFFGDKFALMGYVHKCWRSAVKDQPDTIEKLQSDLNCSGFFAHCIQATYSDCPTGSKSNLYLDPCEKPVMEKVQLSYLPGGLFVSFVGLFFLLLALLDLVFAVRFMNLSKDGRRRRIYHNLPRPPRPPVTFAEAKEARRLFNTVADTPFRTLNGQNACWFLETIFNVGLEPELREYIESQEFLTYDRIMSIYFPYFMVARIDPRQLTSDVLYKAKEVVGVQLLQHEDLHSFATASGFLSPEALYSILANYLSDHFIVDKKELLSIIKYEAKAYRSDDAMFGSLNPYQLEELRSAWAGLNPKIVGSLSNEAIALFYQWLYDECLRGPEHFMEWKQFLDVRGTGEVGWVEFCYFFARNTLLETARNALARSNKELPPELFSREFVRETFGGHVENDVFLPYEYQVPIERLVKVLVDKR